MVRYGVQNIKNRREGNRINRSSSIDDDEGSDEVDNVQRYCYPLDARNISSNSNELTDDDERNQENSCEEDESYEQSTIVEKKPTDGLNLYILYLSIFGIICYTIYINVDGYSNNNRDNEGTFYNDIHNLGKKYKVNYNSILKIQSVITTTFQKEDAASLVFTYDSANSNFNPTNFNQFMNDLALKIARYLRNDNSIQSHVKVDSTKLKMQVHSELIERYRNDVTETGVMLVTDVDEVPSSLAMAFHYYCDEFNPLVKRSAILFTLNIARCSDPKINHASVEKCLANKWTVIPKDNIVPLLTRIVNVVIDVTNVI